MISMRTVRNHLRRLSLHRYSPRPLIGELKDKLVVVCIHGVTSRGTYPGTGNYEGRHVHVDRFREWVLDLRRCFTPVSLERVMDFYQSGAALPDFPALVTFDDGFANNYTTVYPLMAEMDVPFAVFLATRYIGNRKRFWVEVVEFAVTNTEKTAIRKQVLDRELDYSLRNHDEKQAAFKEIIRKFLKERHYSREDLDDAGRELAEELAVDLAGMDGNDDYRFLTWEEIREMADNGVSFGAHTHSHASLGRIDESEAMDEIVSCKNHIENELKSPCMAFAYPYGKDGHYNEQTRLFLKEAGFAVAFTFCGGINGPDEDPWELNRISVGGMTTFTDFIEKALK